MLVPLLLAFFIRGSCHSRVDVLGDALKLIITSLDSDINYAGGTGVGGGQMQYRGDDDTSLLLAALVETMKLQAPPKPVPLSNALRTCTLQIVSG